MKRYLFIGLVAATVGLLTLAPASMAAAKGDTMLVSHKVGSAPADAASAVWNKAKEASFAMTGAGSVEGKSLALKVKSVYTADTLFFRFEWPDKDMSMNKKKWHYSNGKWSKIKGDEDRLGLTFELNRINKFATKGCTVLCHNESKNEKDWYYATSSKKEKGDMWHWKSVRSNPVGYTEDGYVTVNPSKKPEEGRKRDAGKGKAKGNKTKDKSGPAFMQDPTKPASIAGSLLVDEAVAIAPGTTFQDGDEIPGYMVNRKWSGSFADVITQGKWENGKWTVMMKRKLNTGNSDDLKFNTRKKYPFAVAVFDNAHEHNSYNSEPLKIKFK